MTKNGGSSALFRTYRCSSTACREGRPEKQEKCPGRKK